MSTKIGRGRILDKEFPRGYSDSDSSGCISFSSRSYNLDQLGNPTRRSSGLIPFPT